MGRKAAFGRPPASDRMRLWLQATSHTARLNALLAAGVAAIVFVLVAIAVTRDSSGRSSLANATRPNLTPGPAVVATSTTLVGSLFSAGGVADNTVDLFGLNSTTTSTVAVAPAVSTPTTRAGAGPTTTVARTPGTTVPTSAVVITDVPTTTLSAAPTTTTITQVTVPPVTTTTPPVTTTPTTAAPATTPTTAPGIPLPFGLPPFLG